MVAPSSGAPLALSLIVPVLPPHPFAPRLQPRPAPPPLGPVSWGLDGDPSSPNSGRIEPPSDPPISASDTGIFWLNNRPYWLGRLLGRGGFGEVHEVEMLVPHGLEVDWDEDGGLQFDENGGIVLREAGASSESSVQGGDVGNGAGTEEQPWALSFSMTPSEALWFSLVRREEAGAMENSPRMDNAEATRSEAIAKKKENDPDPPVVRYNFLQRSGVFFALKIQKARNKKRLEGLMKEVENLCLLKGKAGIVQLRDHAVDEKSLNLIILMELGACDLNEFFKQRQWGLDVPSMAQVWRALVDRVESLHESDIIHRDIKPQNFILVPTKGHSDTRILARTSTRREDFVFRLVRSEGEGALGKARKQGDVELTIKDTATGEDVVLLLDIKMTDFGLALPLDANREHLSVFGPNGTVVFMAPEAVRQTVSGSRKVSKRVDIWALGVMLYQMLHKGATPVGHYMTKGGPPEALLAVASETVNREAMDFDASEIWQAERARLLRMSATDSLEEQATTADMVHALVVSWVGSEFFVRVCKQCLVFDADNRVGGDDLRGQIDRAIETGWGLQGDHSVVSSSELLQAAFNIDAKKKDGAVSPVQSVDSEVAQIGERVGASLFPTVWTGQDPRRPPSTRNVSNDPEGQRNSNDQDNCRQPRRLRLFLIVVGLLLIGFGGLCATVGLASTRSPSGTPPPPPEFVEGFSHVPSSPAEGQEPAIATVFPSPSVAPAHHPSPSTPALASTPPPAARSSLPKPPSFPAISPPRQNPAESPSHRDPNIRGHDVPISVGSESSPAAPIRPSAPAISPTSRTASKAAAVRKSRRLLARLGGEEVRDAGSEMPGPGPAADLDSAIFDRVVASMSYTEFLLWQNTEFLLWQTRSFSCGPTRDQVRKPASESEIEQMKADQAKIWVTGPRETPAGHPLPRTGTGSSQPSSEGGGFLSGDSAPAATEGDQVRAKPFPRQRSSEGGGFLSGNRAPGVTPGAVPRDRNPWES